MPLAVRRRWWSMSGKKTHSPNEAHSPRPRQVRSLDRQTDAPRLSMCGRSATPARQLRVAWRSSLAALAERWPDLTPTSELLGTCVEESFTSGITLDPCLLYTSPSPRD